MTKARGKRPGWFVSTGDPDDVVEGPYVTLDVARLRSAKASRRLGKRLFVWEWNHANGLRKVRSSSKEGVTHWHRPCGICDEKGCEACEFFGSVVDEKAPIERECDSV